MTLRRRPRSAALLRVGYRIAYRLFSAWAFVRRPAVRGVKCVLDDGSGRVLFVRHQYGDRDHWELPGGGARRLEPGPDAAAREAWEELGADVASSAWEPRGVVVGHWYGKDERLELYGAPWPGGPVRRDPVEIAVAGWFPLSEPPALLGRTTVAALAAMRSS